MGKKIRKIGLIVGILSLVTFQMGTVTIWAQTEEPQVNEEGASFNNSAQAAHAETLTVAQGAAPIDSNLQSNLMKAEEDLAAAKAGGDPDAIAEAQTAYDAALAAYEVALADAITVFAVSVEEIAAMRSQGMGWGQIAQALGVHPGLLGLGHTKKTTEAAGQSESRGGGDGGGRGEGHREGRGGGRGGGQGGGHGEGKDKGK